MRYHDEHRIAPGGDVIVNLLGRTQSPEPPTLIMLDEVLKYFERANAESVAVGQSTLGRQTLDFIQSLSTEVANSSHAVMICSLQASAGEAFGNVALLNVLDHLTARVDAKREPVVGDEIQPVLQRRLLSAPPDEAVSEAVADSYANLVTSMRAANARTASEKRAAQDELLTLRKRYRLAYPFHPALIDLMKERWAAIPEFQCTRGALRFLSAALHALKEGSGLLLGPGDVPLSSGDMQNAFFTEVGQREPFKAVLEADLTGPNARASDIIPPEVARRAIRIITKAVDRFLEDRIPFRVTDEGAGIGVYEIRQRMNGDKFLFAVCQFRLTLTTHQWHLYWMRKFDAWWPYSLPESGPKFTLNARLKQLFEDAHGCFWG